MVYNNMGKQKSKRNGMHENRNKKEMRFILNRLECNVFASDMKEAKRNFVCVENAKKKNEKIEREKMKK